MIDPADDSRFDIIELDPEAAMLAAVMPQGDSIRVSRLGGQRHGSNTWIPDARQHAPAQPGKMSISSRC